MKKILTVIIAVVCMLLLPLGVFAEEAQPGDVNAQVKADIKALKTELEGLRAQAATLHDQAVAKRTEIKDLIAADRAAKAKDKFAAAKESKEALAAINAEIKSLREIKQGLWAELKNARTVKDFETVKDKLAQIIGKKSEIIGKINIKLGIMDQIIAALK